jgi:SAM-dependent methyltransferase
LELTSRRNTLSPTVIWHDVECGGYAADLPLWEELARETSGELLELGCGCGRVTLHLARAGFEVTALDRDGELLDELARRAAAERLAVRTVAADARNLDLAGRFGLIAAPMQLVHLFGIAGRARLLAGAAAHLAPGGRVAVSLLANQREVAEQRSIPLPDVLERDGWIYSSLPIEIRRTNGAVEVRRLRQVVSASGELREDVSITRLELVDADQLELEARRAGLRPTRRMPIASTGEHVGSTVVLLEAA